MVSDLDPQERFMARLRALPLGAEAIGVFFPSQEHVTDPFDMVELYQAGRVLTTMHESYLGAPSDVPSCERYRFLWLRTFHCPVAIRVERHGTSRGLALRVLNGKGGYDPGLLVRSEERAVTAAQWDRLQQRLSAAGFWSLPLRGKQQGLDGARWVLEGARPGEHRIVHRWCPRSDTEDAPFRAACLYLLELGAAGATGEPID